MNDGPKIWTTPEHFGMTQNSLDADTRKLMALGERDALAGKPVEAFYDIPDIDHSGKAREQYERGHYSTCVELDREGHGG